MNKRLIFLLCFLTACASVPLVIPNGAYSSVMPITAQEDYDSIVKCVGLNSKWGKPIIPLSQIKWNKIDSAFTENGNDGGIAGVSDQNHYIITIDTTYWNNRMIIQHELVHTVYRIPKTSSDTMHPNEPFVRCHLFGGTENCISNQNGLVCTTSWPTILIP